MSSREIKKFKIRSLYFKKIKFRRATKPVFLKWGKLYLCNLYMKCYMNFLAQIYYKVQLEKEITLN